MGWVERVGAPWTQEVGVRRVRGPTQIKWGPRRVGPEGWGAQNFALLVCVCCVVFVLCCVVLCCVVLCCVVLCCVVLCLCCVWCVCCVCVCVCLVCVCVCLCVCLCVFVCVVLCCVCCVVLCCVLCCVVCCVVLCCVCLCVFFNRERNGKKSVAERNAQRQHTTSESLIPPCTDQRDQAADPSTPAQASR